MKKTSVIFLLCCVILLAIARQGGTDEQLAEIKPREQKTEIRITAPPYLQPGSPMLVHLDTEIEANNLKAEFNGKEIPIISLQDKWCLAGIDVRKPIGAYNFILYRKSPKGDWEKILERSFVIKKLITPQFNVGKTPKRSKKFGDEYLKERRIINDALAKSSCNILFNGPFSVPLEKMETTSAFGTRRLYKSPKYASIHSGLDLRARVGTKVFAINDGIVILVRKFMLEGNFVVIDHGGKITSSYLHLKTVKVNEGDKVKKSEAIGLSGATGACRGAHLHFGIKINEQNINPLKFIEMINQFI